MTSLGKTHLETDGHQRVKGLKWKNKKEKK